MDHFSHLPTGKLIAAEFAKRREQLEKLSAIDPHATKKLIASLDAKEAENIALLDCALEEEGQEAFGYSAAKREWRETCDADDAAFLAICAYVPRSLRKER